MTVLSGAVVVCSAMFLIGLAAVIVINPPLAARFLGSFASSARAHYTEQALRLVAGGAIVIFAPSMWYPDLFELFGWILIVTAAGLLLVPWRWHNAFGKWAIPLAIRHSKLLALGSATLGLLILWGASRAVLS